MLKTGVIYYVKDRNLPVTGNLGRGVESGPSALNDDTELVGVFTRRDPATVKIRTAGVGVYHTDELEKFKDKIDVLIICGGSATDLPEMTPALAKHFNVIDSFDTHAKIPEHFENVDDAAKIGDNIALISCGWDPGAVLPRKTLYERGSSRRTGLYILGQRCQPRSFRCDSPHKGR